MALLDTTIVNVALPTIRTSLNADEATLSWIISGYALAYGLALIPAGRIGDRIGHKWVFIVGLAGFTLASLAAGLAHDTGTLIVARVVQGLFGGIFFPPVTALIQLMFPPRVRGKAFAIFGAAIGFSTALGPLVGGLLIQWLGDAERVALDLLRQPADRRDRGRRGRSSCCPAAPSRRPRRRWTSSASSCWPAVSSRS